MKQVGIRQAREQLADLVDRAQAGEEIIISRQGKAVARIVPLLAPSKPLPSLRQFRQSVGRKGTSSAQLLRQNRNGR